MNADDGLGSEGQIKKKTNIQFGVSLRVINIKSLIFIKNKY